MDLDVFVKFSSSTHALCSDSKREGHSTIMITAFHRTFLWFADFIISILTPLKTFVVVVVEICVSLLWQTVCVFCCDMVLCCRHNAVDCCWSHWLGTRVSFRLCNLHITT